MAVKKRGLGRGLDALLGGAKPASASLAEDRDGPDDHEDQSAVSQAADTASPSGPPSGQDGDLKTVPIEFIQPGRYQPRLDMHPEKLEELASSIRAQGVMQPIVVRPVGPNRYEIIAGERRWRASQLAQLDKIPVIIKEVPDNAAIAMALIENIQRENLNPIEEAMALKRLQDEFELTQQEVADAVGKSRATVTNLMRLMSLNPDVRKFLEHGDLEMGHARALLALKDGQQSEAANLVIAKALSVRQTESLVRRLLSGKGGKRETGRADPDIKNLQDDLSERLGTQVIVQHSAKGKGKLILKYGSLDQLDGILAHIK